MKESGEMIWQGETELSVAVITDTSVDTTRSSGTEMVGPSELPQNWTFKSTHH